jgi:hypothetical protein
MYIYTDTGKIAAIMLTGQWLAGIRISDLIVFEIFSIWPN